MNPETAHHPVSFALLASGASFSCEVLQALRACHYLPQLLILPEYPPAPERSDPHTQIFESKTGRRMLELATGIELGYAPQAGQANCARLLETRAVDFLLVACWPYLIAEELIASARKAALNLHPSLLPDYPGADPIAQQLLRRESVFGVSLHLLNQRFDQGDIIAQSTLESVPRWPDRAYLERANAQLGVRLFIDAVAGFARGWNPVTQSH
jgi:methionyl-tRNA formyltransferase